MKVRQIKLAGLGLALLAFALEPSSDLSAAAAPHANTQTKAAFTPAQIPSLQAWFDPSQTGGVTQTAGAVSILNDLSGNSNSVSQAKPGLQPVFTANGINGLGSLSFNGKNYLSGAAFSANLFNESTVFVVTNQADATQDSSVLFSGSYDADAHWGLKLSEGHATRYDLGDSAGGRLSANDVASGPALWTAAGSIGSHLQYLRKNGNQLASTAGPAVAVSGAYPLAVGATAQGSSAAYFYSGQLGEALVFNRALSGAESTQIEGYLACKWGLQSRLPANHPYRTLCPQGGTYPSLPLAAAPGGALRDPLQLRSSSGRLVFNVAVSQTSNGTPQFVYNGSAVPPTLRLQPGDTLYVNLMNNLPKPPAGAGYLNDTNLHYHGLHVSPSAPGDDSIDMLAMPGQTLHYRVAIPVDHPSGLYWYHSHAHGEAERQNLAGMSGALVIDGIAQYAPQVANLPERILILRDTPTAGQILPSADRNQVAAMLWAMRRGTGARGISMDSVVHGNTTAKTRNPYVEVNPRFQSFVRPAASSHCLAGSPEAPSRNWTLNGQTQPSIGIRPGEQQFWRLVNAGSDTYLDLSVDKTQMQIVALDGVALASVGNRPMTVSHYLVPPASRVEFIVKGPPPERPRTCGPVASTRARPDSPCPVRRSRRSTRRRRLAILAKRRARTQPQATLHAATLRAHGVAYIRSFVNARGIARTQTLSYSDQDQINGQSYDPAAPPQFYAQNGTMERWQIVNVSSQVHTFHIHQTHFLVQSIAAAARSSRATSAKCSTTSTFRPRRPMDRARSRS